MDPIQTLYQRDAPPASSLPTALADRYDGGLSLPDTASGGRPYIIGNFVETIDGVISFALPGHAGGGDISGNSEPDRFIMGLLRARVDAVIFGTGTLHGDAGHIRTADEIYPDAASDFAALRREVGRSMPNPLNVVVSASGRVHLDEPTFHTPGLSVLIATTAAGHALLARQKLPPGVDVRVIPALTQPKSDAAALPPAPQVGKKEDTDKQGVDPAGLVALLAREYGVRLALHEGGPRLFAAFVAAGMVDELFLTVAPQFAGRSPDATRPALLEGQAFAPDDAPWAGLLSIKRSGAHIFLRYRFKDAGAPRSDR